MVKKLLLLFVLVLSSCTLKSRGDVDILCENTFWLTYDYNDKYSDNDYLTFLSNESYLKTFYYKNASDYNCHYFLKYTNGFLVDEWGTYSISNNAMYVNLYQKNLVFRFTLYGSPTVDFILENELVENGKVYHLVYYGTYKITHN